MAKKTPEEIADMEREVAEYRQQEAAAAAADLKETAKPITDLVASDGFKALRGALVELDKLALDERFSALRSYGQCLRVGVEGIAGMAIIFDGIPAA